MARRTQKVKLNGQELIDVLSVEVSVGTTPNEQGVHRERTRPVHVTITRDASHDPTIHCLNCLIADEGGALTTAEFTFVNQTGKDAYVWKLNRAFVHDWRIVSPKGSDAHEVIELFAGDVTLSVGSETVTFALNDFNPKQ